MNKYVSFSNEGLILSEYILSSLSEPPIGAVAVHESVTPATHWISAGMAIPYTKEQLSDIANRPNEFCKWTPAKGWEDPRTAETEWPLVRARRNKLLQESDWTQLPDVPIATKEAWAVYRQSLRDVTLQPDPFNITWPVPPQE